MADEPLQNYDPFTKNSYPKVRFGISPHTVRVIIKNNGLIIFNYKIKDIIGSDNPIYQHF